jgi:hypothetical protein
MNLFNFRTWMIILALTVVVGCSAFGVPNSTISGIVLDEDGPVSAATVRIQATDIEALTDREGHFTLKGFVSEEPVTVSTWKDNYYCAKVEGVIPPESDITITLIRYQTNDNPDYEWIPPTGADSCASCKPGVTEIWLGNAHAEAAKNPRFITMYNGTDMDGNQSPLTRFEYSRDYGVFPLRPDPKLPYYGPGYKLDFPDTAGNCAACHTPGATLDAPYGTDPNILSGANLFGIHCDFCHKVADVSMNPDTGLPFANMPGVLSLDVRRPFPDDPDRYQLFFGTFDDDNVPEEDTYLPLIETSQFCAPCHFGVFWDTVVYNSFGEWLESPYSDPTFEGAKTCQQCHMPAPSVQNGKVMTNVAPGTGGVERDPMAIHAHLQIGSQDEEFLRNALTMSSTASRDSNKIIVNVDITNDNTGHHIPTGSPLRHLILLVQVVDEEGKTLEQLEGPTVPEWGGVGDPSQGYYAGHPGNAYAKVLQELWTEVYPSGAYWNPTRIISDNRIAASKTASSTYTFSSKNSGGAKIDVFLLFRRSFIELMDQKGWNFPDSEIAHQILKVD